MFYINQFMEITPKFIAAVAINISLFLIIPVTEDIYSIFDETKTVKPQQKTMVAEVVKPEKKPEKKQRKPNIRDVNTSRAQSAKNPMKLSFSPDLTNASSGDGVGIASNDLQTEVFEEGEVDAPATPVYRPQIPYPQQAKKLGIEGSVLIQFSVGRDGKVKTIERVEAPHPSFKKEARKSVEKWKFNPAEKDGIPVESRLRQSIDFNLE